MTARLHILHQGGVAFAGVEDKGRFTDVAVERLSSPSRIGEVLRGRIARVDIRAGFAFVEIGQGRTAFLASRGRRGGRMPSPGDEVVVQVIRDAAGTKLEEVTEDVALAGRYLVHRPFGRGVNASGLLSPAAVRRISGLLDQGVETGGWIIRRAAAQAEDAVVAAERDQHVRLASEVARKPGPTIIQSPGLLGRMLADHPSISSVVAEGRDVADWTRMRLAVPLAHSVPSVADAPSDLAELVERARDPVVPLASGGTITIERTAALTAVDVDTGRSSDPVSNNMEAADAVAVAARLRNIGGIVVVDFVSMERGVERARVAERMRAALAGDPARIAAGERLSPLGLFEFARERRGLGLMDLEEKEGR